ncbi:uncharacterized protein LOC125178082 [Hyalella azteca]|uniref:Uncharacterized protein LOC125178082 n=1 Tax=Hyalella azteca TaxID=294128 RepID=A0A979FLA3_HYAAZ|nr:uncharacterized protein LOC125178082 [Hyalella azteca]
METLISIMGDAGIWMAIDVIGRNGNILTSGGPANGGESSDLVNSSLISGMRSYTKYSVGQTHEEALNICRSLGSYLVIPSVCVLKYLLTIIFSRILTMPACVDLLSALLT